MKDISKKTVEAYLKTPTNFLEGIGEAAKTLFGIDSLRVNNYSESLRNMNHAVHSAETFDGEHFITRHKLHGFFKNNLLNEVTN